MKKIIIPILLVFIVSSSGCTIPGLDFLGGPQVKEYEHDILVIKSIQAIPSEVAPGQQFRIITYIENVGTNTIPQPELQEDKPQIMVELYDYCEGLFTIEDVHCPSGAVEHDGDIGCNINRILPGQIVEVDWIIKPASDIRLETICPADGMKVFVKYPYKTTSLTTITIMDENEMQRQIEEGTFQRKDSYIVAGEGPIKPYLYIEDHQPISQGSGSTVVSLQIENRGSGFLSSETISQGKITIELPEDLFPVNDDECTFEGSGGSYTIKDSEGIRLIYGKSPKLLCEINIPSKEKRNIPKEATLHSTVEIEYEYEFRDKVNILVSPKM